MYSTERIAAFATSVTPADLPKAVMEKARVIVLHTVGCALEGSLFNLSAAVQRAFPLDREGTYAIWGGPRCRDPRTATFLNAFQAQSTLREDMHIPSLSHPGAIIVPTAAAASQCQPVNGAEFLAAVVTGYEVCANLGRVLFTHEFRRRGFRPSGVFGPLGAAVAAGRIFGLTTPQLGHAIGLAANTASGLRQWALEGTPDILFHNGQAATNGLHAALLARAGMEGPRKALEGSAGLAWAYAGEEALEGLPTAVAALGERYAILESFLKGIPGPGMTQTVRQAAAELSGKLPLDSVRAIRIFTNHHGKTNPGHDNPGPFANTFQAQLSSQFAVATALMHGALPESAFTVPHDPAILRLAAIATIHVDPGYEEIFPKRQPGRVEVELVDGRLFREELIDNRPLADAEVPKNWLASVGQILGEAASQTWLTKWEQFPSLTASEVNKLIKDLSLTEHQEGSVY